MSTSREPTITRDRTSRPIRSVPNQCSGLGGRCPVREVVERVVRRDPLAEDGADDPADDDDVPDDEGRAMEQEPDRLAAGLRPLRDGRGDRGSERCRLDDDVHQLVVSRRIRGFIQAVMRSAVRVASM